MFMLSRHKVYYSMTIYYNNKIEVRHLGGNKKYPNVLVGVNISLVEIIYGNSCV